jgi:hypothetical protein
MKYAKIWKHEAKAGKIFVSFAFIVIFTLSCSLVSPGKLILRLAITPPCMIYIIWKGDDHHPGWRHDSASG